MNFTYDYAAVRPVPTSYAEYYNTKSNPIDPSLARHQHDRYVRALEKCGLSVSRLPPADDQPDSVFIEDPAVVWDRRALITRPRPPRDIEVSALEDFFTQTHEIERIRAPAYLEGGDVLHTSLETFVGLSGRTNAEGAKQLKDFLSSSDRPVVAVKIDSGDYLHLKSGATCIGGNLVLQAPGITDLSVFRDYDVISVPRSEWNAANALRINETVLVAEGYPRTAEKVTKTVDRGVDIELVDISEFEKGGGSLTCLSVLW